MSLLDYVNIKQGTRSTMRFSAGNILPLTQLPFAMAAFTPQTDSTRGTWFYHPDDRSLEGIRLTHQAGVWLGDFGALLFVPQAGTPGNMGEMGETPAAAWSSYRPQDAVTAPHYAKFTFQRARADFETVPAERGGFIRVTYDGAGQNWLSVLPPIKGDYTYSYDSDSKRLYGTAGGPTVGNSCNFTMHFVISFDNETKLGDVLISDEHQNTHIQIISKTVTAQIAVSYISREQALLNLGQDRQESFDKAKEFASKKWEGYLSRIEIETETEAQKRTFYTCMYRVFLFPSKCYELDKEGNPVHYSPIDGVTREGKLYTNNVFWDTYRTLYPLYSIIAKEEYAECAEGFIQLYRENGWLPRAPVMGETGCMPSTLIDGFLADGAVKGLIRGELLETAFEGMLKHATTESPRKSSGRNGVTEYQKYGYVPCDVLDQSVNLTLDAAYGDFCIAEMAKLLNKPDIEREFRKRALNYCHLFDKETGFMRGRDTKGKMRENFNPIEWGGDNCESSAWQGTFNVPHDIDGLAELFGGREAMLKKLDALFAEPPHYAVGSYGHTIHEMSEMAAVDFGQCAISNQPSFHIPFLYAALGRHDKTDHWVGRICRELFSAEADGYPGDEDSGTMAAWYIFSSLGLYPICPGKPEFIKTKMQVTSAKILGKDWDSAEYEKYIPYSIFK
ncbi:MAG: GH92 family glycosyl hydrolase [Defluviitaleaceae bacterium]|nr:GH92 family glycosyl hydrolase [Defluviitaleaceae bacterium]